MRAFLLLAAGAALCGSAHAGEHHDAALTPSELRRAAAAQHVRSTAAVITANVTSVENGGWVQVTFSGLAPKDAGAWIGMFVANASVAAIAPVPVSTATPPWTANAPIEYLYTDGIQNASGTGAGTWAFQCISGGQAITFWIFTGGIEKPVALASTGPIAFSDVDAPMRPHLALTRFDGEMQVTWNSIHNDDDPSVQWGTAPGVYSASAPAEPSTLTPDDLCGEPATGHGFVAQNWFLRATMTGLPPSTRIYYVVGSTAHGVTSERSFMTPSPQGPDAPLHVIVLADQGMTTADGTVDHWAEASAWSTSQHAHDAAATGIYALTLHIGDLSYATGYLAKWNLFDHRIDNGLADVMPYMVGLGNHERDYPGSGDAFGGVDSGGECGHLTQARFATPSPGGAGTYVWYAIRQASATIIMLNSELSVEPGSDQYNFLVAEMAATNRTLTPWLIVAFHRPMYYVSSDGNSIDPHFQVLEQAMFDGKVDLVLTGHVHNALITCPVFNGTCVPPSLTYDAPIHAVIGNNGQGLSGVPAKTGPWTAYQANEFGYTLLHVWNATTLTMELYEDATNDLHYTMVIQRSYPRA